MGSNTTNFSDTTSYFDEIKFQIKITHRVYIIIAVSLAIVGTLLNLWFLAAILTSRDMRSRLRNKIICNTLVVHLLDSTIIIPVNAFRLIKGSNQGCFFTSIFSNLSFIQDLIVNWLVVMLLAVFIAQIKDFNPCTRLAPKAVTIITIGLMVLPWVTSLVMVPTIVHEYHSQDLVFISGCFHPSYESAHVFKSIDTAVPIILEIFLIILAAGLRHMRFTLNSSSEEALMTSGAEIDNIFAYATAVIVCTICDLLQLIISFDYYASLISIFITWLKLTVSARIMSEARVVLMTLPWLLLPDVRQRVITWRPWNRSSSGIDLTVTYRKEEI